MRSLWSFEGQWDTQAVFAGWIIRWLCIWTSEVLRSLVLWGWMVIGEEQEPTGELGGYRNGPGWREAKLIGGGEKRGWSPGTLGSNKEGRFQKPANLRLRDCIQVTFPLAGVRLHWKLLGRQTANPSQQGQCVPDPINQLPS